MDKKFSKGFMQDLAYLMDCCAENDTDNLELNFDFNGIELQVYIEFSAIKRGGMND